MLRDPRPGTPGDVLKIRCHRCRGAGRAPCETCRGTGEVFRSVDVRGRAHHDRCTGCFGTRTHRCAICGGEGFVARQ